MKIVTILLAAGSSSRMKQAKQKLLIDQKPMLQYMTELALSASGEVAVILGSESDDHELLIHHLPVTVIHNHEWSKGMGSSIKAGVNHVLQNHLQAEAALIMVCDQPLVTKEHLLLLKKHIASKQKSIVASWYNDQAGVPAVFHSNHFSGLLTIADTHGAKKYIQEHVNETMMVEFPDGAVDLDTLEDYRDFLHIHRP
jgi:molybdenum cofactor cytidylyltransferase